MTVKVETPTLGESITEATVASWIKKEGDTVEQDELIAELETDKINLEINAPSAGVLGKILKQAGDTVSAGDILAEINEGGSSSAPVKEEPKEAKQEEESAKPAPVETAPVESAPAQTAFSSAPAAPYEGPLSPAVKKMIEENAIDPNMIQGSGKDGRITKGDVLAYIENPTSVMPSVKPLEAEAPASAPAPAASTPATKQDVEGLENRVKMSRLRQTIAGRLKTAQNNAAMLTTYNEVDMTAVMELRSQFKDQFEKTHGTKLGFMSFFTKAVIEGLKAWPSLNAEIDGDEVVYKNYYNIGVAVSTEKGLVVPVLKDADKMSFADIENGIKEFAVKARDGKLTPSDMTGGTYTITNGGTFGSLMSMPILNYPQVGILGMHNITQRPMVVNGEIKARPMMFLAMTYDHRLVDGREAVSFLVKVKDCLENPGRMLLNV